MKYLGEFFVPMCFVLAGFVWLEVASYRVCTARGLGFNWLDCSCTVKR